MAGPSRRNPSIRSKGKNGTLGVTLALIDQVVIPSIRSKGKNGDGIEATPRSEACRNPFNQVQR